LSLKLLHRRRKPVILVKPTMRTGFLQLTVLRLGSARLFFNQSGYSAIGKGGTERAPASVKTGMAGEVAI
jgi:hypothetical protein